MMAVKRGIDSNIILIVSFVVTFLVLSTVAALIIYHPQPQATQHIPPLYEVETPDWVKFIPSGPEKVMKMNFTKIYQTIGDFNLFDTEILLEVLGYSTSVTVRNSESVISAYYPNPNPDLEDITLNILKLNSTVYQNLLGQLVTLKITN